MEVKIANAFPMELARIFSELGIFPASFSKYGRGYEVMAARAFSRDICKNTDNYALEWQKGEVAYA